MVDLGISYEVWVVGNRSHLHFFGPCAQWLNSLRPDAGVVWCDLSKYGRLQNDDLNNIMEAVRHILQHAPSHMVAVVIVPVLTSAKVASGLRGEVRPLCIALE